MWKEAMVNVLVGTAGFGRSLWILPACPQSTPKWMKVFLCSLRSRSQWTGSKLDEKHLDPSVLWMALESYYNMSLNRAKNVVLFDIRRLLNIRFDLDKWR